MEVESNARMRAEASFRPTDGRHEKGSAMTIIAAETQATDDKTARLKALRMQRDAAVIPEAPKKKAAAKPRKRAAAQS